MSYKTLYSPELRYLKSHHKYEPAPSAGRASNQNKAAAHKGEGLLQCGTMSLEYSSQRGLPSFTIACL